MFGVTPSPFAGTFPQTQRKTFLEAYHFKSNLSLDELKTKLEGLTDITWYNGSKSFHGDYISATTKLGSVIRIFHQGNGFDFDFLNKTSSEVECAKDLASYREILTSAGGTDFEPASDYY